MSVTVLVVEDEVKIRDLLRRYLEREDLAVVTTGSGAEAMSILEPVGSICSSWTLSPMLPVRRSLRSSRVVSRS